MDERVINKLDEIEQRYMRLEGQMAEEEIATDPKRLMELGRERADLETLVESYRRYKDIVRQVRDAEEMRAGSDPDLAEMAREELERLEEQERASAEEIKRLL